MNQIERMLIRGILAILPLCTLPAVGSGADRPTWLVIVGAGGTAEYAEQFAGAAAVWTELGTSQGFETVLIGPVASPATENVDLNEVSDLHRIQSFLGKRATAGDHPLLIVLIGHGTFDGDEAKFNLAGADLSARALDDFLSGVRRPVALINCSSSSAPFINSLSRPGRCIVTATRSGFEQNYSRFAVQFADVLARRGADLDKDGQISVLEAFLAASRQVDRFYSEQGWLATEHALLDDNADERGSQANQFPQLISELAGDSLPPPEGRLARSMILVSSPQERQLTDEQRQIRADLESQIARLRARKSEFGDEEEYFRLLEPLFLQLAELYEDDSSAAANPEVPASN